MRYLMLFALVSVLTACGEPSTETSETVASSSAVEAVSAPEVRYDVPALIGLSKAEIDAKWGNPDCPPKNACVYGEMLEVFYVDGKAANFTLPPVDDLRVYGFELGEPDFANPEIELERWETNLNGNPVEVSSNDDFFVYVKTAEP